MKLKSVSTQATEDNLSSIWYGGHFLHLDWFSFQIFNVSFWTWIDLLFLCISIDTVLHIATSPSVCSLEDSRWNNCWYSSGITSTLPYMARFYYRGNQGSHRIIFQPNEAFYSLKIARERERYKRETIVSLCSFHKKERMKVKIKKKDFNRFRTIQHHFPTSISKNKCFAIPALPCCVLIDWNSLTYKIRLKIRRQQTMPPCLW